MDQTHFQVYGYNFKTPNKQRLEVQRLILMSQIYERKIHSQTTELAEKFACVEMQIDPTSDGAWITTGQNADRTSLKECPSMVIPLKRRMKYDSRTITLICQMMFSKRPEVRGSPKLDLNSKLDMKQMQQLLQNPDDILATALADAKLTSEEVLAVLFPRVDQKETVCIACDKAVNFP